MITGSAFETTVTGRPANPMNPMVQTMHTITMIAGSSVPRNFLKQWKNPKNTSRMAIGINLRESLLIPS